MDIKPANGEAGVRCWRETTSGLGLPPATGVVVACAWLNLIDPRVHATQLDSAAGFEQRPWNGRTELELTEESSVYLSLLSPCALGAAQTSPSRLQSWRPWRCCRALSL
jgi:hypothetical protein